ncbi:hypothetical protein HHI36_021338 [Cryptolaemus montrouzieri]|uniref:Uncharacterized protein n=1 Tax=Cryptolaemus montrouzieri TaxID=559131 RepID=A0ABD2MXA5_9CUCU
MRVLLIVLYYLSFAYNTFEIRTYHCTIPKFPNGRMRIRQRGRFVKYNCNLGFLLSGDKYSNCVHGKWDSPPPKCVRPGCRKVNPPNNGLIYPSHMNAVLHFYCKSGFDLRGPNVTHCNGTNWSFSMPICLPSNSKPPLSCDFEKPDICGWTHDLNHDFDWRRMQFNTPSGAIGTGPSFDHTYGEDKGGYYMYIESSSRNENDTARLISPVYDKTMNDTCFQFFYHMYGITLGSLRVYMKMVNESWNLNPSKAFFEKNGNQGNEWIGYNHLFGPIPNDYQIIIEGVRGNGYVSDIAIDDVKIIENCKIEDLEEAEPTTTTEMPEEYGTTDLFPDDLFSCENKCFSNELLVGRHRICACDEECFERNNCCPDFIDFCLLQGPSFTNFEETSSSSSSFTTDLTSPIWTKPTTERITSKTTPKIIEKESTTQKTTISIVYKLPPLTEAVTENNIQKTATQSIETRTTTENNIIIQETERIVKTNTDLSNIIPQIPNDMIPIEDIAHLKRKFNVKMVMTKPKEEDNRFLYISLGGTVVIIVVLAVILYARRSRKLRSRGLRSASHGDSASDVRFLTKDEFLDLNLDY